MIGHNPTTELLKIYDTKKEKPFEFLHTRSFININVATGWVVSTSGKFPYENKIALPVESGDFPVTLEYQPLATIQPNVNETCAPSNFPYIETTGINEVTLYAFAVPSATQMTPIVVTLTQNGSPYGSTNASAARSTIEQTSIQLSQNYFVIETREEKTIKEEVIEFKVTAYKGGELINISSSGTPENWLFTQAGLPIEGTALVITPSLENEYITATLTIPEGTELPDGSAIFYFPVQAGGIFYPRATITSTTSSQIIDQVSSYEMIIDDISRATNGTYYVNGVAGGSLKLRVDRKTLNGAINTVGGRWVFSEGDEFLFEENSSGELVLNTQKLQNFNGHNEVNIDFYLDNQLLMTKTIYIEITDFSIILQTSVDYIIPDSTPNLRITSYYLLESGTLVSKNGTISVFRNEVGGELIASESNVSSLMVPLQSFDYSSLSRLVITFKDINNNQQEVKIIPVVGVGDTETEIFNLLTVPSVLTVQTDSNENIIGGTPQSELVVFRNGENVTSDFDFTVTPASDEKFTYKIEDEVIKIENFTTITSQYVLNITATHQHNASIKVQGILQVTRDMQELAPSYYTHIKYMNNLNDDSSTMSDEEGVYRGIAVSTSKVAPTDKDAYKWIKNPEDGKDGKGVVSTARHYAISESGTNPPAEDSTDWKGDLPKTADHKGEYLWTKITIFYTDESSSVIYNVSYIAVDGADGVAGKDSKLLNLVASSQTITFDQDGTANPSNQSISITSYIQNMEGVPEFTITPYKNGVAQTSAVITNVVRILMTSDNRDLFDVGGKFLAAGGLIDTITLTEADFEDGIEKVVITATLGNLTDTITVVKIFNGKEGEDGKDGKDGYTPIKGTDYFDGVDGQDGTTIISAVVDYKNHTNGATAPTGEWDDSPSPVEGQYLWTRTVTTYSNNDEVTTYSVAYQAVDGTDGLPGKGISTTLVEYVKSTTTTMPNAGWSITRPTVNKGEYLWIRTTINYTSGDPSVSISNSYVPTDGQSGSSAYLWVMYSKNANGESMTDDPTDAEYIGIATTLESEPDPEAPTDISAYTWSLIKGTDGIPGEDGKDGQTSYLHIKYSNDGGETFTDNDGEDVGEWIGTYVDFTKADSDKVTDYTWNKVKGEDGQDGEDGSVLHVRYSFDGETFSLAEEEGGELGVAPGPYLGNWVINDPDDPYYKTLTITDEMSEETLKELFDNFTWVKIEGNPGLDGNQGTPGGALKIVGPSNLKFYYSGAEYKPVSDILTYSIDSYLNTYINQQWFFLNNDGEWLEITQDENLTSRRLLLNINEGITYNEYNSEGQLLGTKNYSINNRNELTIKVTADLGGNEISDIHTTFFLYSHSGDYFAEILTKNGDTSFSFPKDQYGNIISGTRMSREPLELELFVFKGAKRLTLKETVHSPGQTTLEDLKNTFDLKGTTLDSNNESIFSLSNQGIDTSVTIKDNQIILTVNNVTENEGKVRFTVIAEGTQEIALEFSWNTYQTIVSKEGSINVYSNFNTFISNNLSMNQINALLDEGFTLNDSHFVKRTLSISAEAKNTSFKKWYYSTDGGITKIEIISDKNLYSGNLIDDSVAEVMPGQQYLLLSSGVIDYSFQTNNIIVATGRSATGNKTWLTAPNGASQLVIETEEATTALFKIDLSKIVAEKDLDIEKPQYPLENGYSFLHTTTNINKVGTFYNQGLTDPVKFAFNDSQTEITLTKENGNHVIHFDKYLPSDNKFFLDYFSELTIIGEDVEERTSSVIIKREFNPYDSLAKAEEQLDLLAAKERLTYTDFDLIKNFVNNIIKINEGLTKSINATNDTKRPAVSNTYNLAKDLVRDFKIPNDEINIEWEKDLETTLKGNPNSFFAATLLEESGYLIELVLKNNFKDSAVQFVLVSNNEEVREIEIEGSGTDASLTTHYFIIRPSKDTLYEVADLSVWRAQAISSGYTDAANATEITIAADLSGIGVKNVIFNFRTTGADKIPSVDGFQVVELYPELTSKGENLKTQFPEVFGDPSDYHTLKNKELELEGLIETLELEFEETNIISNEELSTILGVSNGLDWLKSKFSESWSLQEDVRSQISTLQSNISLKTSFEIKRTSNEMSMGYFDQGSFISGLRITPHGTLLKDEKIQIVGSTSIGALYGRKIVIGKDPSPADYADDKTFESSLDGGFLGIWNQEIEAWASNLDTQGHAFYRYALGEDGTAETLKGYMIMNGQEIAAYQYNEAIDNGFRDVSPFNILLENYTSYPVFQILDTGVVSVKDISLGSGDGDNYREGEMDLFGLTKVIPFAVSNITIRDLHGTETPGQVRKGIVFVGSGII